MLAVLLLLLITGPALAEAPPLRLAQVGGEIQVRALTTQPGGPGPAAPPATAAGFQEPVPLVPLTPQYPRGARLAGEEGLVTACFIVDEAGAVLKPDIRASTNPLFDEAVLAALVQTRFAPALAGGQPVRSTACRTFRFLLQ